MMLYGQTAGLWSTVVITCELVGLISKLIFPFPLHSIELLCLNNITYKDAIDSHICRINTTCNKCNFTMTLIFHCYLDLNALICLN